MMTIAAAVQYALTRELFGRRTPHALGDEQKSDCWFVSISECSPDRGLWHLHGAVKLLSKRNKQRFERVGETILRDACMRHHGPRGVMALNPSIDIAKLGDSAGFIRYANKQAWADFEGMAIWL